MVLDREITTIVINKHGFDLSWKLREFFRSVRILATFETVEKYSLPIDKESTFSHLNDIFKTVVENRLDTIAFMASGIAVRSIYAVSKYTDAAIVLVDNCGRYAISLMSGHEGGANHLAYNVASILGAEPIITTFTEVSKRYILGLGCRKGVDTETLAKGVIMFLESKNLSLSQIRHISTCSIKLKEKSVWELESYLKLPVYFVPEERFKLPYYKFKESTAKKYFDIPSVAEASALLSGRNARIVAPKESFASFTLALAEESI